MIETMNPEMKPGYKKTKIGWIPENWEIFRLESVCSIIQDGTHFSPKVIEKGRYKYITSKNIRNGRLDLSDVSYISKENHENIFKRCPVKLGDVLLTKDGANTGNVCLNTISEEFSILSSIALLRANTRHTNNEFILFSIQSPGGQKKIRDAIAGQAITRITLNTIKKILFAYPPFPEQHKIVKILIAWDKAIELTQRLITAKKQQKKALMQQLLTGKKRFREFRNEIWKQIRLKEVVLLVNGMAFKPGDWSKEGLPIIRIQNLNGINQFNYYKGECDKKYLVEKGDLLYSWSGSRGTSFGAYLWTGEQAILNQHIFKVIVNTTNNRIYVFYLLNWITTKIEKRAHGSAGLVHVTKKQLENEKFFISHNYNEQQKIAAVLQTADSEIALLKKKLEKLHQQKKGLMQVLLTGKVRVKTGESDDMKI